MIKFLKIVLVLPLLAACSGKETAGTEEESEVVSIPVITMAVARESIDDSFILPATAEAKNYSSVIFQAGGEIRNVHVKEGDWVNRGAYLMTLDNSSQQATFRRSESAADFAQKNFERIQNLYNENLISRKEYEEAEQGAVNAQSDLESSRRLLYDTHVVTPVSGYIDRLYFDRREIAVVGQVAATIINTSGMEAIVGVSESDVLHLKVGDPVRLQHSAAGGVEYRGLITHIGLTANENSKTYRTVVDIENPGNLRPGMVLKAIFIRRSYENAILIPLDTILIRGERYTLFVDRGGIAKELAPEFGPIIGESIIVLSGLEEGEQLVVSGQQYLADGVRIFEGVSP